jgi:hypothetical protein
MRIGVLRFPGSNCDDDSLHVVTTVLTHRCRGDSAAAERLS